MTADGIVAWCATDRQSATATVRDYVVATSTGTPIWAATGV